MWWLMWLIVLLGGALGWSSSMLLMVTIRQNKRLRWRFFLLTLILCAVLFVAAEAFGPMLPLDKTESR